MILPFSTQLNGKPTYFVERIWEGLLRHHFEDDKEYVQFMNDHEARFGTHWDWFPDEVYRMEAPKIHTIREDVNDRWKAGNNIDFFINCRQKNMFRFAPVLPVVSVQRIEIVYYTDREVLMKDLPPKTAISVDDRRLSETEILQLALNDGFDSVKDFFAYFNEDYEGKIIHWTDKQY